jgi:predicted flap endonuclease-1-like 5' DNA nuclease
MKTTDGLKHRRKKVPFALGGLLVGAGIALWLVRRQQKLMPWTAIDRDVDDFSIYKVSGEYPGDFAGDWPAGMGDLRPAAATLEKPVALVDAEPVSDDSSADWGDAPAMDPAASAAAPAAPAGEAAAAGESAGAESVDSAGEPPRRRRSALEEIEGIGPQNAKKLSDVGLFTADDLLRAGADPKRREGLVASTGIDLQSILRWVNQADLFRIKGVGEQYADLLEAAGVDTVPELAQRRADNLTKKMVEVNEAKGLVRRTPTETQVAAWIAEAKDLPRVVTY